MLNQQPGLDRLFHALSDPARRTMLERLTRGPAPVSELARPLPMSLPSAMQHLGVLEDAGLVRTQKVGRVRTCALEPAALSQAEQWINARRTEWEQRLDRLGDYLKTLESEGDGDGATIERAMVQPKPLTLTRTLHARRATVFRAWSAAEHVARWFSPATFSVSAANVELRVGGPFEVCMRAPDGQEHWMRGVVAEVKPEERLVIESQVEDQAGRPLFSARTEVDFADALGGTRLDITQTYVLFDPAAEAMTAGAAEGWRSTLEKLESEVLRMQGAQETDARSVVHATFHLERTYPAAPSRVWRALTDPDAKAKWFGGPAGQLELIERSMDVRPGGRERMKGRWEGGVVSTFDACYHDVIEAERLVYSYDMYLNDKKISVSLSTMQLKAEAGGTRLMVTEQGAFLDGYDDAGSREHGTGLLLDALGASLAD